MGEVSEKNFTSLDDLIRLRAKTHHNDPLLSYPDLEGQFTSYTGAEVERLTRAVAIHYAQSLCKSAGSEQLTDNVALVDVSSLEYYLTFLALQRLGLSTFFISPRLADQGFAHLLKRTGCRVVVTSHALRETIDRVDRDFDLHLEIHELVEMGSLDDFASRSLDGFAPLGNVDDQKFIIHSGGTSGLPKPVAVAATAWLIQASAIATRMPQVDTLSTLPLFHSFGLATLLRCLVNGRKLSLMNASRPITASAISTAVDATASRAIVTVPYILKFFTELDHGVEKMAQLKQVVVAGSAVPGPLAEALIRGNVNVFHLYGLTECGALMEPTPADFRWVTPLPHASPFLRFDPVEDGLYHLTVLPGLPAKVMSTAEDGSYATKDLFHRHPREPNVWRFAARQDDIIVMLNGEKADPTPLEDAVVRHENVKAAVVFGADRESLGMIVIASDKAVSLSAEEVVESIGPELELGNSRVPAYARITSDAVIVKASGTVYPQTDKHTIMRARFLEQIADDVERHYEEAARLNVPEQHLSEPEIRGALRGIVKRVLRLSDQNRPLGDDEDFFSLGMDSLQASRARSWLLKTIHPGNRPLATNVMFEHPSVDLLTAHILAVLNGNKDGDGKSAKDLAEALISRYSRFEHIATGTVVSREVSALLTGATGTIGVHILHQLLLNDSVAQVHCLVRASSCAAALGRIHDALKHVRLLDSLAPDEHLSKLRAHSCDFAAAELGLEDALITELRSSTTHIIHNAWSVNFNQSLRSFEQQAIRSAHFLLSLAASSTLIEKPVFTFISSIAVTLRSADELTPVVEDLVSWESVADLGYAQSKYVGERIADAASKIANVPVRIARVGQVCGDTIHGMWNPTEAVPLTVQAAITMGALPKVTGGDETLRWLPADLVGKALVELMLLDVVDSRTSLVVHISNDSAIRWNSQFLPWLRQCGLEFDTLPQGEWLRKLEASDQDGQRNPTVKLIDFFRRKYGGDARRDPSLDTSKSRSLLTCLQKPVEIDVELVRKFVVYWNDCWRLKSAD